MQQQVTTNALPHSPSPQAANVTVGAIGNAGDNVAKSY